MLKAQVYKDIDAPPIALLVAFISSYGPEALEWDSQVIRNEIEKDNNINLEDLQSDKLNAAIEVLTSNLYEQNWNVFETVGHLLANVPVNHEVVSPLSPEEIIKALAEAYLIRHEDFDFCSDIRLYVGKIFHDYGMSKPPKLFASAIMPEGVICDDTDKNKALQELFDYEVGRAVEYIEKLET
jgi:hypothetical protein